MKSNSKKHYFLITLNLSSYQNQILEFFEKSAPSISVTMKCPESALKFNTETRDICGLPSFFK